MRARHGAAFTLAILALALGTSACGGSAAEQTTTSAAVRTAEAHWRAGLLRWHRSMLGALNGISIVFSTDAGVAALQTSGTRGYRELTRDEHALATCSIILGRLGPAPESFAAARNYAVKACANFEKGEKLVEAAVREVRNSTPLDPLQAATGPLSTGESEMNAATVALTAGSQ